jgi:hypothetical protein
MYSVTMYYNVRTRKALRNLTRIRPRGEARAHPAHLRDTRALSMQTALRAA